MAKALPSPRIVTPPRRSLRIGTPLRRSPRIQARGTPTSPGSERTLTPPRTTASRRAVNPTAMPSRVPRRRHRKIYRDGLESTKYNDIRRLGYRAGVVRMGGELVVQEVKKALREYTVRLLTTAVTLCEHGRRKVVRGSDVVLAAKLLGRPLYI